LGKLVEEGQALEFLGAALSLVENGGVTEDLDGTGYDSICISDGLNVDEYGDAAAHFVAEKDGVFVAFAVGDAGGEWAAVAAKVFALHVDVAEDVVLAIATDDFFGGIAGEAVGAFVPVLDAAVTIYEVDPVAHVFNQIFIELNAIWCHEGGPP
jgi:hypothetical protein